MGLELETPTSSGGSIQEHSVPPPRIDLEQPRRRRPKALDPAAREKSAERSRVLRIAKKLKRAKTEAELRELAAEHLGVKADAGAPPPPAPDAPPAVLPPRSQAAETLWGTFQQLCGETRFAIDDTKREALIVGTGPCIEKYLGGAFNSVEAVAAVTVIAVFGQPLLELAKERMEARKAAPLVAPPAGATPAPVSRPEAHAQ